MNLTQAKSISGITWHVSGKKGFETARRHCVEKIVEARRNGDDQKAAELSQAKEFFKRRSIQNTCSACGTTINKSASRCRNCQRAPKALRDGCPPPRKSIQRNARKKPPVRRRQFGGGDILAQMGYWASPVQRVVKKWRDEIGESWCKYYFPQCSGSIFEGCNIQVECVNEEHKGFIVDVLSACYAVFRDTSKPDRWLLEFASGGEDFDENGKPLPRTFARIIELIAASGGPRFTVNAITKAEKRLKLHLSAKT